MEDRVHGIMRVSGMEGASRYLLLYYDAACLQAAVAKHALETRERLTAEQRWLVQQDLDRALELLDKARASFEFKRIGLDEIRKEPLLDPLRTDPRFQLLMMDLAFPDNPFGS